MRIRRYLFTASLAVLLWLVWLGMLKNPLFPFIRTSPQIALILIALLFGSTLAGIWVVDAYRKWSTGTEMPIGLEAAGIRFGIAFVATTIFCLPLRTMLTFLSGSPFSYVEALLSHGLSVLGSVWLATQIVEFLVHKRT